MFQMRDYQKKAVDSAVEFFLHWNYKWWLAILPTWSWKSIVIANIAQQLDGHILILQPSAEILEQNYNKLIDAWAEDCKIYSASMKSKEIGKMTLAMIGSIINQKDLFDHFDYIIIDECHLVDHEKWQYKHMIESIWCKVLWLTATPYRLKIYQTAPMLKFLTRVKNPIFQKVVHVTQIKDIDCLWFLSDVKYYEIKAIKQSELRVNSTGNDYTDKSMREHFDDIQLDEKVIEIVERVNNKRNHILVFTRFVEDADRIQYKLNQKWIKSAYVSWETKKKERKQILDDFRSWKIKVVLNVWVLTTWFDFPALDTVINTRPTRSLGLYYQIVGRGMRPHESKDACRFIDMTETYKRFWEVRDLYIQNQWWGKREYAHTENNWQMYS